MELFSWNSTYGNAAPPKWRSYVSTVDTLRYGNIVLGEWTLSPRKRGPMSPRFLVLLAALTLCLLASSLNAQTATLERPLTPPLMSCMELERNTNKSYLSQGCTPIDTQAGPEVWSRVWRCGRFEPYFFMLSKIAPQFDSQWCVTSRNVCTAFGEELQVTTLRARHGQEKCSA